MQLLQSKRSGTSSENKNLLIISSGMWYAFGFSLNIVVFIVQSGLKLCDFTILDIGAGVETKQVYNPFAQQNHRVRFWSI